MYRIQCTGRNRSEQLVTREKNFHNYTVRLSWRE